MYHYVLSKANLNLCTVALRNHSNKLGNYFFSLQGWLRSIGKKIETMYVMRHGNIKETTIIL